MLGSSVPSANTAGAAKPGEAQRGSKRVASADRGGQASGMDGGPVCLLPLLSPAEHTLPWAPGG